MRKGWTHNIALRENKCREMYQMNNSNGSKYDKLFYPFLFEGGKVDVKEVLRQVQQSTIQKCQEVIAIRKATMESNSQLIISTGIAMAAAFSKGATLFAFGNGGSTSDAQDIVVDLFNPLYHNWKQLPTVALTNDVSVITAVGNDVGFENVFARQIIALGRKEDIALGISTSGNSKNVIAALKQAKKQDMLTVAIAGYDGGKMARSQFVDFCLITPSDYVPRLQEAQATVYHTVLHVVQAVIANPDLY